MAAALLFSLPLLGVFAGSGCGRRLTNANVEAVNKEWERSEKGTRGEIADRGVSPKEVESILGPPNRVETFKIPVQTSQPMLDGVRYHYEQDGETIEFHFIDGKMIGRAPLFQKEGQKQVAAETK